MLCIGTILPNIVFYFLSSWVTLARLYKLTGLLDITELGLCTSELTELNTVIAGVLLNFSHCQLWQLATVTFRATKNEDIMILSTVRVDIPINCQSWQP